MQIWGVDNAPWAACVFLWPGCVWGCVLWNEGPSGRRIEWKGAARWSAVQLCADGCVALLRDDGSFAELLRANRTRPTPSRPAKGWHCERHKMGGCDCLAASVLRSQCAQRCAVQRAGQLEVHAETPHSDRRGPPHGCGAAGGAVATAHQPTWEHPTLNLRSTLTPGRVCKVCKGVEGNPLRGNSRVWCVTDSTVFLHI